MTSSREFAHVNVDYSFRQLMGALFRSADSSRADECEDGRVNHLAISSKKFLGESDYPFRPDASLRCVVCACAQLVQTSDLWK